MPAQVAAATVRIMEPLGQRFLIRQESRVESLYQQAAKRWCGSRNSAVRYIQRIGDNRGHLAQVHRLELCMISGSGINR
ncbi:hypothetical protein D3C85_1356250 [compost metagenome]